MKKLLPLLFFLWTTFGMAQSYPSPSFVTQGFLSNSNLAATTGFTKQSILAATGTIPILNVSGGTYNFATVGTGASLVVFATGGVINSIPTIAVGGSGYQVGDCLILNGGNGDAIARVTSVSSGAVTAASVVYGGTGYTTGATLAVMALPPGSRTANLTGTLTSNMLIIIPAGTYLQGARRVSFTNNTTGAFTITVKLSNGTGGSTGNGVILPQGSNNSTSILLYTDGQNDVWPEIGTFAANATPNLGTPSAVVLTNATGLPTSSITGLGTGVATALSNAVTGSGSIVLATNPSIGTPASLTLTNATGLPLTGLTGLGTGVAAALGNSPNSSAGVALVNGSITTNDCVQWTSSGIQDAGAPCIYDGTVVNVKSPTYGALGNSNGTHGNGHDDTTAIQSALTAASGGSIFLPCGTYRITATLTVTDGKPRYIYGHGICSKIFNDAATAQATLSFAPSSGTCSSAQLAPCLILAGINFLPPNVTGGAQSAVSLTNTNAPYIYNNTFNGQNAGVTLAASYAPRVIGNQFISGAVGVFSVDTSANGAEIASNGFYGMSSDAIDISPVSGCTEATSIRNNDIEQNAVGILIGGLCGGSIVDNYIEASNTQSTIAFTGTTNSALEFHGNNLNAATNTGTGTISIAHINIGNFQRNYFLNATVSYGTGATLVRLRATENSLTTATLPASTVACTGLGTGGTCSVTGDDYSGTVALTTGSASTGTSGTVTLTFTNSIGSNGSSCTWTPVAGTANWSSASFFVSSTAVGSNQVSWSQASNLTVSKVYQLGYLCTGY
jgi:hypothetical protein